MYASIPSLTMDQPLALTKNSMDATRTVGITPTLTSVERQQVLASGLTRKWVAVEILAADTMRTSQT